MKTVLCFGDSNTWGYDPLSLHSGPFPRRHGPDVRWTGVLGRELGQGFRVIEEGQNGRTTVHDDPFNMARNGRDYLPACLESHKPLDLVVMMLGSNDLKTFFNLPPADVAAGAGVLARMILTSQSGPENGPPRLLLVCPPRVGDLSSLPEVAERIADGPARSARLPRYYEALALSLGCGYLNSQEHTRPSLADGIHLDPADHHSLGVAVAAKIRSLL